MGAAHIITEDWRSHSLLSKTWARRGRNGSNLSSKVLRLKRDVLAQEQHGVHPSPALLFNLGPGPCRPSTLVRADRLN